MTSEKIQLRYDGPILASHSMDVGDLAPALLAFGNLCKEANKTLNGDRSSVKVMMNADVQANCITVSLDVVQSVIEHAKALLTEENISTAKEILGYILGGGATAGASVGVLQLLKIQSNRKVKEETTITDSDGNNTISIKFEGDNNTVIVSPQVAQLAANKKVITAVQGVVAPVANIDGIDSAEFDIGGKKRLQIDKDFAKSISTIIPVEEEHTEDVSVVVGHIIIHSPTFAPDSKIWSFKYSDKIEQIDISETTIAKDVLARGKCVVGDTYRVKMEVTEKKSGRGYKNFYKIKEVLDFIPGQEQTDMNFTT